MPNPIIISRPDSGEEITHPVDGTSWFVSGEQIALDPTDVGRHPFQPHVFRLHEYADGVVIVVGGVRISRRQLLSYVANTRGGNHWDPSGKKQDIDRFKVLETLSNGPSVSGRDPSFYALMSITQEIGKADDVAALEERILTLVPPDPSRR